MVKLLAFFLPVEMDEYFKVLFTVPYNPGFKFELYGYQYPNVKVCRGLVNIP